MYTFIIYFIYYFDNVLLSESVERGCPPSMSY